MITHKGFVLMTPNGGYIARSTTLIHGGHTRSVFMNAPTLDQATLFPTNKPPSDSKNQDWSRIASGRCNLVPVPAITRLVTEIRA